MAISVGGQRRDLLQLPQQRATAGKNFILCPSPVTQVTQKTQKPGMPKLATLAFLATLLPLTGQLKKAQRGRGCGFLHNGVPGKTQRSGFAGERRKHGARELSTSVGSDGCAVASDERASRAFVRLCRTWRRRKPADSGQKPGPTSTVVPYHSLPAKAESSFIAHCLLSKRDPLAAVGGSAALRMRRTPCGCCAGLSFGWERENGDAA